MDRFSVIFRIGTGVNLASPLIPVLAALIQGRSGRYRDYRWMNRLAFLLIYGLIVNWAMVGLSVNHIHNAWLADPGYFIESLLTLWVLAALGRRKLPRALLLASAGGVVASAAWDAWRIGLRGIWPVAETTAGSIQLGLCLWLLFDLLLANDPEPTWHQPTFWLLSSWALMHAIDLTFYPIRNFILQGLSREWILIPSFAKYVIGLLLNLGVARTFLCPKPSSS